MKLYSTTDYIDASKCRIMKSILSILACILSVLTQSIAQNQYDEILLDYFNTDSNGSATIS